MNERALYSEDECPGDPPPFREGAIVRQLTICNKKGLHARASAKFVQTVEKFDADVRVMRSGGIPRTVMTSRRVNSDTARKCVHRASPA